MSTSCFIGTQRESGYIRGIICTHDGYPKYAGTILHCKYQNLNKIEKLISLGEISILGENIEPKSNEPHGYPDYQRCTVLAYKRDLSSYSDIGAGIDTDIKKSVRISDLGLMGVEYAYIWDIVGKYWHTYKVEGIDISKINEVKIDYRYYIKKLEDARYMTSCTSQEIDKVKEDFKKINK